MFGFTIISDREYQDLVSGNQTLRDRVNHFESESKIHFEQAKGFSDLLELLIKERTELYEAAEGFERRIAERRASNEILESKNRSLRFRMFKIQGQRDRLKSASETKSATIKFYSEKIVATDLELEEIRACYKNLSNKNQEYVEEIINCRIEAEEINKNLNRLSTENQKHIDAIADHLAEKNQAEQLRNETTIQLGLTKAENQNYRLSVQTAVDQLAIAVNRVTI